jgi:murein DD-endopeptidase MepM/ murein hydrolase activator NlpD
MSQSAASQSQQPARAQQAARTQHSSPRDAARRNNPRQHTTGQRGGRTGYTIAHAGRQVRFGPVAFWIAVGTIVIMAGWSITTATYFAFRDDVLKGLIARQAEQQFGYEDRIAELRARIDRTTSRQLLDQEQFEQKLDDIARRQAALESRATALGGIADPTTTGSIRPPGRAPETTGSKPSPISNMMFTLPRSDRGKQSSIQAKLGRIEASLDHVESRESTTLSQVEDRYENKARLLRSVFAQLGLKSDAALSAAGGPFVPIKIPPADQGFERGLIRANVARAYVDRLSTTLVSVPVRKPVTGEIDLTSPFGVRVDPFVHTPAMHTGLDFRGELGESIHATAAGTVTIAAWTGGYGKMVEINHGNGLATRYGHLSEIDVSVGDKIRIGQIVGKLGSTGRSTGPHLHYETRVDGEAVNPQKFLDAGARLFGG